jgi:hypothetical protein
MPLTQFGVIAAPDPSRMFAAWVFQPAQTGCHTVHPLPNNACKTTMMDARAKPRLEDQAALGGKFARRAFLAVAAQFCDKTPIC